MGPALLMFKYRHRLRRLAGLEFDLNSLLNLHRLSYMIELVLWSTRILAVFF
jgi:hypothetical protein